MGMHRLPPIALELCEEDKEGVPLHRLPPMAPELREEDEEGVPLHKLPAWPPELIEEGECGTHCTGCRTWHTSSPMGSRRGAF